MVLNATDNHYSPSRLDSYGRDLPRRQFCPQCDTAPTAETISTVTRDSGRPDARIMRRVLFGCPAGHQWAVEWAVLS